MKKGFIRSQIEALLKTDIQEQIAVRAYYIHERSNGASSAMDDWLEAEKEVYDEIIDRTKELIDQLEVPPSTSSENLCATNKKYYCRDLQSILLKYANNKGIFE